MLCVHLISNFMLHVDDTMEPKIEESVLLLYGIKEMIKRFFMAGARGREKEINKSDCVAHVTVL